MFLKTSYIGFETISVFRLRQFPSIKSAKQLWNTLKTTHIFVGLVGQSQHALYVLWFCFGVIVPVDKSFVFKSRPKRKIKICTVNRYPKFFGSPNIRKGIMNSLHLAVIPKVLVVIHFNHTCASEFFHLHLGTWCGVPSAWVIRRFFFKFPNKIGSLKCLFSWYCILDNYVSIF